MKLVYSYCCDKEHKTIGRHFNNSHAHCSTYICTTIRLYFLYVWFTWLFNDSQTASNYKLGGKCLRCLKKVYIFSWTLVRDCHLHTTRSAFPLLLTCNAVTCNVATFSQYTKNDPFWNSSFRNGFTIYSSKYGNNRQDVINRNLEILFTYVNLI